MGEKGDVYKVCLFCARGVRSMEGVDSPWLRCTLIQNSHGWLTFLTVCFVFIAAGSMHFEGRHILNFDT